MPSETRKLINTSMNSSNPAYIWISACRELLIYMTGISCHLVLACATHKP
jgi:hypothetical protein